MNSRLNPYLSFKDNAREAMEFYKTIFGGTLTLDTFGENQGTGNADEDKKIMHAMLEAENGIVFMASETPSGMEFHDGSRITMSLSGDNAPELEGYWNKLLEGGMEVLPLETAPWGDKFGMVVDRFGICWMVNITPKQ